MGDPTSRSRERVARNFIRTYGRARFRRLIEALGSSESGQVVAEEFGVSRERVRQWKNIFGDLITVYRLHPEIERILNERRLPRPPAPAPAPDLSDLDPADPADLALSDPEDPSEDPSDPPA